MNKGLSRISASSYSNTAPLVWSFLYGANRGKFELILDNAPARSAQLLAEKRVDTALVPVIEYQRIEDVLLVPQVCVGAKEKVRSVCLVTNGADLCDVQTVSLDVSSRTSVALTKIIFSEFLGKQPTYRAASPNLEEMLAESDCALLIGDPALTVDESKYKKFDLAETWKKYTNRGFVFAMWMAQREKSKVARAIDFAAARDEGLAHLNEIISNYETEIPIAREDFHRYLAENITYMLDEDMLEGMLLFYKLAKNNHLIDNFLPLRFV